MGPALVNAPSTPPGLNKPTGVIQHLHSTQPIHGATRTEIQWPSLSPHLGQQVHGRRARWFLAGARLVCGPRGWGSSGVMPLTMGWQWGRREHRLSVGCCSSQPVPLVQFTSKSASNLATSQQFCKYIIPLSPLTQRLGTGEKHHLKAQMKRHQVPSAFHFPPNPLPPKFPFLTRDSISTCALFGSFHTFLLAGDKISGERQTKALGARHWLSLP